MRFGIEIGNYVGLAAFFGIALLLPLFVSQAREVHRLRTWMALTPEPRIAEREAAEAARIVQAQEAAAAHPYAEPRPVPGLVPPRIPPAGAPVAGGTPAQGIAPVPSPSSGATPPRPLSPAERIALDRPATARITAERTAVHPRVQPHPPVAERATGRTLAAAVSAVLVLGIIVVLVSVQLSDDGADRPRSQSRPSAVVPSEVEAAVLNGTAEPGLAGRVADDLEANDYVVGAVTNSQTPFEETTVMFAPGSQREAQAVASDLGAVRVEPMDSETRAIAGSSSVAVIAGEDRVGG